MPFNLESYFKFSPLFANNENLSEKERTLINEKSEKIPVVEREFLVDPSTAKSIEDMMGALGLTEKQVIVISVLVRRIFLRDSSKNTLVNDIIKYVNVDQESADKIIQYLEQNIFSKVPEPQPEDVKKPASGGNVVDLKNR